MNPGLEYIVQMLYYCRSKLDPNCAKDEEMHAAVSDFVNKMEEYGNEEHIERIQCLLNSNSAESDECFYYIALLKIGAEIQYRKLLQLYKIDPKNKVFKYVGQKSMEIISFLEACCDVEKQRMDIVMESIQSAKLKVKLKLIRNKISLLDLPQYLCESFICDVGAILGVGMKI